MQASIAAGCRLLEWDSKHFGLRIARVTASQPDEHLLREALLWARRSSIDCMYLLVDSNDAVTIRLAGELGWRFVDVRVTLGLPLSAVQEGAPAIRQATTDDIPHLRRLASRSHEDSRFYADGNFPRKACDELFAYWIERSVRDREFAGAVFVPDGGGNEPTGYITCSIQEGAGRIGLIAVDEKARGTGLATQLLAESSKWFAAQGAARVSVATQGSNVAALRFYERRGFCVESVQLWFHWWREPRA